MNQERSEQNTPADSSSAPDKKSTPESKADHALQQPSGKPEHLADKAPSKAPPSSSPADKHADNHTNKNKMKTQHQPTPASAPSGERKPAEQNSSGGKENSSSLMLNIMSVMSFLLAVTAIVLAVVIWMSMDKVDRRVEQQLAGINSTITDAQSSAKTAKELAQQSFDKYNEAAGKISFTSSEIDKLHEQASRVDAISEQIKSIRTLDGDLYGALEIAQIQAQLVGSPEPVLFTLKAIDERLQRQGQSPQSELRKAIAQDMEAISEVAAPDVLLMSNAVSGLLDKSDQWRLVIDAPLANDFTKQEEPATPQNTVESGIAQEVLTPKPEGNVFEKGWEWTSDKAGTLGTSTWRELTSIIRITPIKNPEAVLMSPEQGAILRENMKLRLLNLRLSLLQKQYDAAQTDIVKIQAILEKYYVTSDSNVADTLQKLKQLQAQAQAVEIPEPTKTKMALIALNNRQ